jgi:peptidoglycan hydrolase-like protein with peptidoglycan-binding domain
VVKSVSGGSSSARSANRSQQTQQTKQTQQTQQTTPDKSSTAQSADSAQSTQTVETARATQDEVRTSRARANATEQMVAAQLQDKVAGPNDDQSYGQVQQQQQQQLQAKYGDQLNVDKAAIAEKADKLNSYTAADSALVDSIKSGGPGELSRGHKADAVRDAQAALNKHGFGLAQDGLLGPRTEAAVKQFQKANGLPETGTIDAATNKALQDTPAGALEGKIDTSQLPKGPTPISGGKLPSAERQQMIKDAILKDPKIPDAWANDPSKLAAINRIVEKESGWRVGVPNYTIRQAGLTGDQAAQLLQNNKNLTKFGAKSSAMGLFQLLGTNMDKYQPGGRTTIGDAQSEMIGGLRYMADRYGTPERALAFHNANNWW